MYPVISIRIIFPGLVLELLPFSGMVDGLISKTLAWEDEKKKLFLYDGVSFTALKKFLDYLFFLDGNFK